MNLDNIFEKSSIDGYYHIPSTKGTLFTQLCSCEVCSPKIILITSLDQYHYVCQNEECGKIIGHRNFSMEKCWEEFRTEEKKKINE